MTPNLSPPAGGRRTIAIAYVALVIVACTVTLPAVVYDRGDGLQLGPLLLLGLPSSLVAVLLGALCSLGPDLLEHTVLWIAFPLACVANLALILQTDA